MRRRALAGIAVLLVPLWLGACGNDDDAAAAGEPTHDDFMHAVCEKAGTSDAGPFDAFFKAHPEPKLADWVEGLPPAIEQVQTFHDAIAFAPRPKADDAKVEKALGAIDVVTHDWEQSLDAAKAGDQAAFDTLDKKAQDTDVPAMFAAMQALDSRSCAEVLGTGSSGTSS